MASNWKVVYLNCYASDETLHPNLYLKDRLPIKGAVFFVSYYTVLVAIVETVVFVDEIYSAKIIILS